MTQNLTQQIPVPHTPMVDPKSGIPTATWVQFFVNLLQRTGGASGSPSNFLDNISNAVGSVLYRASSAWQALAAGAQYRVLRMGASVPEWDLLDGNSFASQAKAQFFASPTVSNGIPVFRGLSPTDFGSQAADTFLAAPTSLGGTPVFRVISTIDLQSTAGEYPGTATNDNAAAGNIGEFITASIAFGSAIGLTTASPKNLTSIALTPGDWDVWGFIGFTFGAGTSITVLSASAAGTINVIAAVDSGQTAQYAAAAEVPPADVILVIPMQRVSIAGNATRFLNAEATFTVSTASVYGTINARRAR